MKSRPERIDEAFLKDMQDMAKIRIMRGLADPFDKREHSLREITSLFRRCSNYPKCLEELKTKPKKK